MSAVEVDRSLCVCGGKRMHHEGDPDGCWCRSCTNWRVTNGERCQVFRPVPPDTVVGTPHRPRANAVSPETSHRAAEVARLRVGTRRYEVFHVIRVAGAAGSTDDEIEQVLLKSHQTVSATRNGLMEDGLIVDSGQRRATRYGNDAIVWVVADLAPWQPRPNS